MNQGESGGEEMISAGELGTPRKLADSMSRLQVTDKVVSSPPVHFSDDSNQAILGMILLFVFVLIIKLKSNKVV
jgi:uncharacterized membrane protein